MINIHVTISTVGDNLQIEFGGEIEGEASFPERIIGDKVIQNLRNFTAQLEAKGHPKARTVFAPKPN